MEAIFKFELGDELKDIVSGFRGFVETRIQCLNKCKRYTIQPKVTKDGTLPDACDIDEQQLIRISKSKIKINEEEKIKGGPRRRYKLH